MKEELFRRWERGEWDEVLERCFEVPHDKYIWPEEFEGDDDERDSDSDQG